MRVMQLMRKELLVRKKRFEKLPLFDCVAGELLAVGRVLSQRAKSAARLSRQPARSHRRQPPFHSVSSFRRKRISSIRSTENVEMLHAL
ncbi:hypothetical protein AUC31_08185 [Planococcus rifietoensis]|uniref:Uncharacterized protein n=1 Tax=Planococcus rifietoensis TaxID=200991 RepID=A0A0U2XGH5_9BACL|nr:hypothetical protein AUC31_08185 [Planococcus rifietoensis]